MKMTRKLIPALVMLLVSAIMLSTASYAWFASNSEVEANGMKVQVKSDAAFLEISNTATGGVWKNAASAANDGTAALKLVTTTIVENTSTADTFEWKTGEGSDPTSSALKGELKTVESEKLAEYVRTDKFYIRMSSGSQTQLANVKVSSISIGTTTIGVNNDLQNALRVLIVGSNGEAQIWSNDDDDGAADGKLVALGNGDAAKVICDQVPTSDASAEITVYIYFDGNADEAYTNNATLESIANSLSITINFIAESAPAAT